MSIAVRSLVDLSTHCAVGLHHDCRDDDRNQDRRVDR